MNFGDAMKRSQVLGYDLQKKTLSSYERPKTFNVHLFSRFVYLKLG